MATQFPGEPPTPGEARERMQRVRVGLTGLAAVLLIVALATAIASSVRRTASAERSMASAPAIESVKTGSDNAIDPRAEPLAQLGVAPGATEKVVTVSPGKRPR